MCGYVACVPECCASTTDRTTTLQQSDDGRLLPKHVGASILNKGVLQFSAVLVISTNSYVSL
jgi:hypothetical protein